MCLVLYFLCAGANSSKSNLSDKLSAMVIINQVDIVFSFSFLHSIIMMMVTKKKKLKKDVLI